MSIWQRITREPNLILGVLTAGLSLAVLFGVDLSVEQLAGIGTFVGAVVALVRFIVAPASEVIAQQKPGESTPVAGQAAIVETGAPVAVALTPLPPANPGVPRAEAGAIDVGTAVLIAVLVILLLVVLGLLPLR